MEKSDKLYRFRSKSQHMLVISYLGRKMKVKFSTPYSGVSRYSTSSEVIARQIRNSQAFRSGAIVEDESVAHRPKNEAQPIAKKAAEPKGTPTWMEQGMKSSKKKSATPVVSASHNGGMASEAEEEPSKKESSGANPKIIQDEMFQMSLEDVETYMDAKQYVNDVLHADLTRKEEVKAYCMEHNVVFPNFSFD